MPNIFAEFILTGLRFAALWVVFYLLHRPTTKMRTVAAICLMIVQLPICRIFFFASGRNFAAGIAVDMLIFLILAYLCRGEGEDGDLTRPIVSAIYLNSIVQLIYFVLSCYAYAIIGGVPQSFTIPVYIFKSVEALILLCWTVFYYRIARNMTARMPFPFTILTITTPLLGLAVVAASSSVANLDYGNKMILFGGLFGTLILALNMCVFYLYVKLSVANESLRFAQEIAHTPPVWTREKGLSAAFIKKYEITPREQQVIETLLLGKTDKEIAIALDVAVNTVQAHLKRVYRKTGAAGRFALSALVRGDSN